jgi:hypothetical protein
MQQQQPVQMATPLNKLPLKTTRPDTSDLEDPMIQNVLKEFEDEMAQQQVSAPQMNYQQPQQAQQQQQFQHLNNQQQLPYNYQQQYQFNPHQSASTNQKKLINMDLVKKTLIITIIVFLLQNYNVINILISKLPEVVAKYISGKEIFINFFLIFLIFYAMMFYDLL